MTTKAQLEADLDAAEYMIEQLHDELAGRIETHEQLRKRVAREAIRQGVEQGWCEQLFTSLRKLGLGEFIPDIYRVQWRAKQGYGARRRVWHTYGGFFLTAKEALDSENWVEHDTDPTRIVKMRGRKVLEVIAEDSAYHGIVKAPTA